MARQNIGKRKKMELLAKLDNFGPFQFFFTLSCGDKRWNENFSALLHEFDMNISYERDDLTSEINVFITIDGEQLTLEEYINDTRFRNDTRHKRIRKNVLTVTRNFDNRVKEFFGILGWPKKIQ